MKLQGFDYFVTKYGLAVFPDLIFNVAPNHKMVSVTLEPNDTICFFKGVHWVWDGKNFKITSGGSPALFRKYDVKTQEWIVIK